jgi:hypothetical protein
MKSAYRTSVASLFLLAVLCGGLEARRLPRIKCDVPANAATRGVHEEAMRILNSIQLTEYRHKTNIDEKNGAYYCDCSGFVGYVLNRTVAKDDKKGPFGNGKSRPLAMDYEKGFSKAPTKSFLPCALPQGENFGPRWQQVVRVIDARPGDVVAWRHEKPKPGNTGHVVIVDHAPVIEKDGLVRMDIIDSTTLPSSDITKEKGKTGIGRRTMWFTVDKCGRPLGTVRGKRTAKPKVEAISIGRALPAAEKRTVTRRAA